MIMHLTDYFMEVITYVVYFQKTVTVKQPRYEQIKADILRLLAKSEDCLKNDLFPREDYDHARFAVCAWADEVVLNSAWAQKNQWQKESLQRAYYHTTDAGEEFFERLNALGLHQGQVREVYYFCLSLGFTGRYCHKGDEYLLEQLKTSNLKILMGSSVGLPSLERAELFPEAYPNEIVLDGRKRKKFRFSVVAIASGAGSVLFFGLLFLIYRFVLGSIGNNIL